MANELALILVGRIKELLDAKGWNYARFSEETGIARPHITNLMKGGQSVSFAKLEVIAKALGVEPSELLDRKKPTLPTLHDHSESGKRSIPYWGEVSAGKPIRPPVDPPMIAVPGLSSNPEERYVCFVIRDSMFGIPAGFRIVIRVFPGAVTGDLVLAEIEGRMLVGKYQESESGDKSVIIKGKRKPVSIGKDDSVVGVWSDIQADPKNIDLRNL